MKGLLISSVLVEFIWLITQREEMRRLIKGITFPKLYSFSLKTLFHPPQGPIKTQNLTYLNDFLFLSFKSLSNLHWFPFQSLCTFWSHPYSRTPPIRPTSLQLIIENLLVGSILWFFCFFITKFVVNHCFQQIHSNLIRLWGRFRFGWFWRLQLLLL